MTAYTDLMTFQRETEALAQVSGRLEWDQETVMPRGAAPQRAEEIGALEAVLHARRTDPRIGDWLDAAEGAETDEVARANLRRIRHAYTRTQRVPARLAAELARVTSVSQGIWAEARAAEDFAAFAPTLEQIVALTRDKAAALADGGAPYDALLDDYEPGATADSLTAMFGALRPRLVALRDRIMGAERRSPALSGDFPEAAQMALTREMAQAFGYDMTRGRIDKAVHPFSSGGGADVRITTRTSATDPFNCLYSTIHEVGHAAYEQGIDPVHALTPLGQGVSMGVHESQSRIYENQLGRSRAFTSHIFARMTDTFGPLSVDSPEAFYAAVNRVHPGFIRTESDEVQYNLHVLLRFDLERRLIDGSLPVADLPEAWNTRFEADFGVAVDRPSNGCLQDVHWSVGLFGYFPTYTLGNVYAGCLHAALRRDLPDLDTRLAAGDPGPATGWLRDKLQRHGALRPPRATIAHATGEEPSEGPLLDYLEAKFGEIYGV
ncbi:carboxypeptidase M32 [Mesobaculum littorinae]|uniref:Metal-dependent carboxypeptidase n=1 Tax=Mesobaculum littorinae TaxID=2486419 RepID=A0A438AMG1_9RHOB|nr:carboxypeptidase M32 [Mesobaculum littorinae]RVV99736.1 carboxypeptidase M32 [Mesobaculum littorinae]